MKQTFKLIFSRYGASIFMIVFEILQILAVCFLIMYFVPYFWVAFLVTTLVLIMFIINSKSIPEYKITWLVIVIFLPVIGPLLYSLFYRRELTKVEINNLTLITSRTQSLIDNSFPLDNLKHIDKIIFTQAKYITESSKRQLHTHSSSKYYGFGQDMFIDMLIDLKNAKDFIFMEYFIIEKGKMWNSIHEILIEKAKQGVEIKLMFDDVGNAPTLPSNYERTLKEEGIECYRFSKLRPVASPMHNNRDHRKIMVVDGLVGYTGGVNLADEYINETVKYGYWKDGGIRITGDAVNSLTIMFLEMWDMTSKQRTHYKHYLKEIVIPNSDDGFYLPFGDGPKPFYEDNIAKTVYMNIFNQAKDYIYIMTPYLIIDNELTSSIKNASKRGVDVRIITPHIADKGLIHMMTRNCYDEFIESGVQIYEYEKGFIHSKNVLADSEVGVVGTINFDYRSLMHHFENGVWMYKTKSLVSLEEDFNNTFKESILINENPIKTHWLKKIIKSIIEIFAPLM